MNPDRIEKGLLGLALLLLFGLAVSVVHSFDIFWQLQSGKFIWQTGSFLYHDTFSLAAETIRWEHCWLHDVIFYGMYGLGGYAGLSLLKGILIAATALSTVWVARIRGASYLSILFLVPPAVLCTGGGWLERPQLWSFLFLVLFLLVLERFRRYGGAVIFLLIPLMIIWSNLHAGALIGFPVMLAYLVGEGGKLLVRRPGSSSFSSYGALCLATVGVLAASLVTPYGFEILRALAVAPRLGVESGQVTQIYNMDWRTTSFFHEPYFFYAMAIAGVILLLGWKRLSLTDLLLLGGMALMGMKLGRHTPFFFLTAGALLPYYTDGALTSFLTKAGKKAKITLRVLGHAAAIAVIIFLAWPAYQTYGLFSTGLRTWHYPIEAAEFVREQKLPANLYNTYDWGGYLMWALYPEYRVFWDGRSNSPVMFRLGLEVMAGNPAWDQILDRYGVNTVVTKACTVDNGQRYPLIDQLRQSPAWSLVFADESSLVFVRKDAVPRRWLSRHELPDERIDDTILSEAYLLTRVDPRRYMAYWEIARIYFDRRQYLLAADALRKHLLHAPLHRRHPEAENYYRILYPMLESRLRGMQ